VFFKRFYEVAKLQLIDINLIDPHPKNPRVVIRDDVVSGISSQIKEAGGYQQQHAIHARPIEAGRFQVVSGHHRRLSAIDAKCKQVWCWVEDMADETAFMLLVLANNQGELDPLEIGIHAFEAVPTSKGGRGKKGGLSEYAEKIGKGQNNVTAYRNAGEVILNVSIDRYLFLGRAQLGRGLVALLGELAALPAAPLRHRDQLAIGLVDDVLVLVRLLHLEHKHFHLRCFLLPKCFLLRVFPKLFFLVSYYLFLNEFCSNFQNYNRIYS
jgi:hypothetical protein